MSDKKAIRWWPLWLIVLFDLGLLGWIFLFREGAQVTLTILAQVITVVLSLLWVLFLSRMAWKNRLTIFFGTIVLFGIAGSLLKVKDIDGDVVPTLTWRWEHNVYSNKIERFAEVDVDEKNYMDYPQYLGEHRNAIFNGIKLDTDWKKNPPKLIWKRDVGLGWSSFAVRDKWAITQEQHKEEEMVICYELFSGKVKWTHQDKVRHDSPLGGVGPRATPTIDGKYVYTLGATGILNCLDFETGKKIWSRDILTENNANNVEWGKSCSPLVYNNLVVVSAGGKEGKSLVAYNKTTGDFAWGAGNDTSSYSSPVVATIHDVQQILMFNQHSVASHHLKNGQILWEMPWGKTGSANIAMPIVKDNQVLFASGYGIGSKLLQINKENDLFSITLLWENRRMKPKFTNVVFLDGYVYGLDEGVLGCIDFKTGERKWREGRYKHGQLILVNDLLLVHSEDGYLALVKATPEEFKELAILTTFNEKSWNPPTLAGRYLLLRNHRSAMLYELPILK